MKNQLLLSHNYIDVSAKKDASPANNETLMTMLSNMIYYGFIPSNEMLEVFKTFSKASLTKFWKAYEPHFQSITGSDRDMGEHVVYKNFPKEVLDKSQAEYWLAQILMYLGVNKDYFTEEKGIKNPLKENLSLKVLSIPKENTLELIYTSYISQTSRWTENQLAEVDYLFNNSKLTEIDLNDFGFKENGIKVINKAIDKGLRIVINDATDILRLAALMSEQDVSLRTPVKFRRFKRSERKLLLSILDKTKNLDNDIATRTEIWKKFFVSLHPGDYKFENVKKAYDLLYKGSLVSFNKEVEFKIKSKDDSVIKLIQTRPGEFVRRFHKLYEVFNQKAVEGLSTILPSLNTIQLLKLQKYILTINTRNMLIYAPKGNWTKAKFTMNEKVKLEQDVVDKLNKEIELQIKSRLDKLIPEGVSLDMDADNVKLQTNDQELASYGRGTIFDIPKEVSFIRSASYWQMESASNIWFDNSWNFFDEYWCQKETCCWDSTSVHNNGAIFSGDPTSSQSENGKACQMIDLNLDQLEKSGVRYAVWSLLCYSSYSFEAAQEVLAALQWGEDAQSGQLFEPSRAQMVFPVKGKNLTKYIAYIDIKERKLIYMDANLNGSVMSAGLNSETLMSTMPAFIEYLKTLPSVADLFINATQGTTEVMYSDKGKSIKSKAAYVFKPENVENKYDSIDINKLL